jgi:general secretion pathway protein F/type IV pilus assembly protein PilC
MQSYADFATLLGSFLKAGATFELAWREAGESSQDSRLGDYACRIADGARDGVPPGKMLNPKETYFPPEFISLYISGEQTGQLEKNLDLLARLFQEKANLKLKQASEWYPIVVFLCVAVYVGWGIVRFYNQYLDLLMSILRPGHTLGAHDGK